MPQIRLRGIPAERACEGSRELVQQLAERLDTRSDWFTLEAVHSSFIRDGELVQPDPTIEVLWFDRGLEAQDDVARLLTAWIQGLGYASVDIWFTALDTRRYYENGQHFG